MVLSTVDNLISRVGNIGNISNAGNISGFVYSKQSYK